VITIAVKPSRALDAEVVRAALDSVPDPEIPGVSIVELGMIGDIEVANDGIRVELLPTFVGCPAIEMIRNSIETRLAEFGRPVDVDVSFGEVFVGGAFLITVQTGATAGSSLNFASALSRMLRLT